MPSEYVKALQQGVTKTLPSGMEVRLRPVDASILLSQQLPRPLMLIVQRYMGIVQQDKSSQQLQDTLESEASQIVQDNGAFQTMLDMRNFGAIVARASFVWPRIVDDPKGEDEISADWMETDDLIAITRIIGLPLVQLIPFRFEQSKNLEPVRSGEGDVSAAEPSAGAGLLGSEPDGSGERLVDQLPV